jgi:hypothetical protein
MTKKTLLYLLMVLLVGFIVYINHKVDDSAKLQTAASGTTSSSPQPAEQKQEAADLVGENAEGYGIGLEKTEETGKNEGEWTAEMSKTLDQSATLDSMGQGVWEDLKNNPARLKEKLERVEEELRQQEVKVRQYPTDPDQKSRLQSLYMLKATLNAMMQKLATGQPGQ